MSVHVRHPIWLPAVRPADARTFATLYAIESFARATVSSVIPIQAYEILRSEQTVSILSTLVSLTGRSVPLVVPLLVRRSSRRRVYTPGAALPARGARTFVIDTHEAQ